MSETPSASRGLKGRDLITVGIFTALYFVINFLFMLLSGLHPYLWVFMPAIDALFAGIPFMLACAKVPKFGTVLIIGMVPSLIYFITGMFTPLILGLMFASCVVAEIIRAATRYESFAGNAVAYAVFGFGMCGSPLPLWVFHDSFVAQIAGQGMGADYLATLETAANPGMLVAMFAATSSRGSSAPTSPRDVQEALRESWPGVMRASETDTRRILGVRKGKGLIDPDPRTLMGVLVAVSVTAFMDKSIESELLLVLMVSVLQALCGHVRMAVGFAVLYAALWAALNVVLPGVGGVAATMFTISLTFARKIYLCLMVGTCS